MKQRLVFHRHREPPAGGVAIQAAAPYRPNDPIESWFPDLIHVLDGNRSAIPVNHDPI